MKKLTTIFMVIPLLLFCALKVGAVEKEERKWQDESVYFIMVDRFMNGNGDNDYQVQVDAPKAYHGGDLEGVTEKLDYIKDLGFTTIRLTPIMDNGEQGYHGYWVKDFRTVEEHFGTMADAKKLVKEAHKRDLKVIFDFVVSHTDKEHPWVTEEGKENWYVEKGSTDQQTNGEASWEAGLPELNIDHPEVNQYLLDTAKYWIEETNVDGFHLNTPVSEAFWHDLSTHVRSVKEDFFLMGEVGSAETADRTDDDRVEVEGFVNDPFMMESREAFHKVGQPLGSLYDVWEHNQQVYESPFLLGNRIDNHLQPRFSRLSIQEKQNPITRLKLSLTYMFSSPGIPMMYYGTEVPLDGGDPPANHEMMNFKAGDDSLDERIQNLTAIRNKYPAMTRGDFKELYNDDGLAVFKRSYEGQSLIIAINNATETRSTVIESLADDQQLRGILHDGIFRQQKEGTYNLGMSRETADVFIVEADQGYNWLFIGFVLGVLGIFIVAVTMISIKNRRKK